MSSPDMGSCHSRFRLRLATQALILASGLAAVGACASGPRLTVNPVTPTPTNTYHIGKIVWYDLVTDDVPAVKNFYSELFGWDYEEIQGREAAYTVIMHDGTAIGGIVPMAEDSDRDVSSSRWLSSMSVEDVDQAVEQVERLGGTVNGGGTDYPDRGRLALVTDPQGAMLIFVRATTGDPPDLPVGSDPIPNRWMWTELWAHDVGAAVEFYGALVGYQTETFDIPGDADYQVLMRDGRRRAGIIHLPWEEVVPNWLPYVNVTDPVDVAKRVEELGGAVLIPPQPGIRSASVGVVTDPSGAAFAIQKWPVDDNDSGGRP